MSALRFIKEEAIPATGVSSISITNVFSDEFDVYCLMGTNISTNSTSHDNVQARLIDETDTIRNSSYDTSQQDGAAEGAISAILGTNASSFGNASFMTSDLEPESLAMVWWIFNPYSASSYTYAYWQGGASLAGLTRMRKGVGVLKSTDRITGFYIYQNNSSRLMNSGHLRVYGLSVN